MQVNTSAPTRPNMWDTPSIAKQTPWECGIFNFGKALMQGADYFNCGIVQRPDGLFLIVRRSRLGARNALRINDIIAFRMEGKTLSFGQKIKMEKRARMEQFEDPRAIYYDGKTYVSCCSFIRNKRGCTHPHQIIAEVNENWESVRRYDPVYGKNGNDTRCNIGPEKNWLWFFHNNFPALIYKACPHTIEKFSQDFCASHSHSAYQSEWDSSIWHHGEIRGGTPPVLVDGEYWTFFHSHTPYSDGMRQYHMGAYAFQSHPPFAITRITSEPLLSGSRLDRTSPKKPLVVFPQGALLQHDNWLIVGGCNDLDCFHITIPHSELTGRLIKL